MSEAMIDQAAGAVAPAAMKTPTERVQDFGAALRRRWPAALLVFALTLASAAMLTVMQHKKYDATAQILLQPTDAVQSTISPGSVSSQADAQRDITTNTQIITVDPVASAVRSQLHLNTTLPAIVSLISVSGQETSNLVSITARATTPVQAARLATAFATQYQNYRQQIAVQQIDRTLAAAKADPLSKVKGSPVALRVQQLQAAAASETGGVQIVRPATVPSSPSSPNLRSAIALGAIVGLVLAFAAVLGLEAFDRRVVGVQQFQTAFGAPVLASIPDGGRRSNATHHRAERQRAYADLAARLAFTRIAEGSRVIMVSPASEQEGAGAIVLALTEALCVLGRRVVLVEADLGGRPALRTGDSEERGGLTSVLTGHSSFVREVTDVHFVAGSTNHRELEPWALVSYSTLPSGPRVAEPEALLGRAAMRDVLEEAKERSDLVLVLTGPLNQPSGVLPLACLCDGVIVLTQRSIRTDRAQEIVDLLGAAGAPLLGTVLVSGGYAEESSTGEKRDFAGPARWPEPSSTNGNGEHSRASLTTPRGNRGGE
jgi:capsular polysaccharide biosynthesis protein/MinD-like ATPase involved in chromosome partitioning or flagellar assembly